MPTPGDTLIVGIGNPLRGDDGVGQAFVQRFALRYPELAQCAAVQQLLPEFAAQLAGWRRVVFVDAAVDCEPGEVVVGRLQPRTNDGSLSHEMSISQLLQLTAALYGEAPTAWCIRIGARQFEDDSVLSPSVAAAIDDALARVVELLAMVETDREANHA